MVERDGDGDCGREREKDREKEREMEEEMEKEKDTLARRKYLRGPGLRSMWAGRPFENGKILSLD